MGGSILEQSCIETHCSLEQLEAVLGVACPWSNSDLHRVEICKSKTLKVGTGPDSDVVLENHSELSTQVAVASKAQDSAIMVLISFIRDSLAKWGEHTALAHLDDIVTALKVSRLKTYTFQGMFFAVDTVDRCDFNQGW